MNSSLRGKWQGVVKVQLSRVTSAECQQVLVYDERRVILDERDASDAIKDFMAGRDKRYAYAHVTDDDQISLDDYAPDQDLVNHARSSLVA